MTTQPNPWLALDIGGANLKAAHSSGSALSQSFPVWKTPERLGPAIKALANRFPRTVQVALTMTAEFCDCYETKVDGVQQILEAAENALPGRTLWVWGLDDAFHSLPSIRKTPRLAAASNWSALANSVARSFPDSQGLLIDIGSTTTDLIPFQSATVRALGRTDLERLQTRELVYAGVGRTPLCSLANQIRFRGGSIGLASELFATTKDVYLTLSAIADDRNDCETADGRPATRIRALDRLARMVGADREGFFENDAQELSLAFDQLLVRRLEEAISEVVSRLATPFDLVVISGAGEFLGRRLARRIGAEGIRVVSLSEIYGAEVSTAACAQALLNLSSDEQLFEAV